jgi:hypothetical protein
MDENRGAPDGSLYGVWYNKQTGQEYRLWRGEDSYDFPADGYTRAAPIPGEPFQHYNAVTDSWAADAGAEAEKRRAQIYERLAGIDALSADRKVRKLLIDAAKEEDKKGEDYARLKELEDESELLREELRGLECRR